MKTPVPLYAANDWIHKMKLYEVADGAIEKSALTTGTASGFIATSPTGTIADPSLVIDVEYIEDEWWRVSMQSSILDQTVLDALATTTLYAVIIHSGGVKTYIELKYYPARVAKVS